MAIRKRQEMPRVCNTCGRTSDEVHFNFNGHQDEDGNKLLRDKCEDHEVKSRLKSKRVTLKTIKNRATHHGGSSSSPQRTL